MRRWLLALSLLVSATAARGEPIEWLCRVDNRIPAIVCENPATGDDVLDRDPGPVAQAQVRQALFAPGRGRNVTRLVREAPRQFAALSWEIPLLAPAFDDDLVGLLAKSVMCGHEAECRTILTSGPDLHAAR
jgi:hypothetical protein